MRNSKNFKDSEGRPVINGWSLNTWLENGITYKDMESWTDRKNRLAAERQDKKETREAREIFSRIVDNIALD
jgi:hypothetical protein